MATPFTFSGSLVYPPDAGQPNAARAFSNSGNFDVKAEYEYALVGAGTQVVDFGSVANAKGALVELASDAGAPVNLRVNGGTDDIEVAPGGFFCLSSPSPSVGLSALSIVHTANAKVSVYILG